MAGQVQRTEAHGSHGQVPWARMEFLQDVSEAHLVLGKYPQNCPPIQTPLNTHGGGAQYT